MKQATSESKDTPPQTAIRNDWYAAGALTLLAAILIFVRLDNCLLWEDEAQTALVSRMVVQYGVPLGFDGRHSFSQEKGAEFGPDSLWRWHTWLSFYWLAAFFSIFGESTFVARLPFALCGVACVPATYWLTRALWNDRKTAIAAAMALTLMVPHLILSRQCRYYTLCELFATTAVLGYVKLTPGTRWGAALLVASLFLLFQSHFIYFPTTAAALVVHAAIWHRRRLKPLALSLAVAMAACSPWGVWFLGMRYFGRVGSPVKEDFATFHYFATYASQLERHVTSLSFLSLAIACGVISIIRGRRDALLEAGRWRPVALPSLVVGVTLLVIAYVSPLPFFRYLAPILPFLAILIGRVVVRAFEVHWLVGLIAIALYLYPQPLRDHVYELTHDFKGPMDGFVSYLNRHGSPDQTVAITYGDLPLKFYTNLRIIGCIAGDMETTDVLPDWIIDRTYEVTPGEYPRRYWIAGLLRGGGYERTELDYPDTPWENREDPSIHFFRTVEGVPRISIWKRIDPASKRTESP